MLHPADTRTRPLPRFHFAVQVATTVGLLWLLASSAQTHELYLHVSNTEGSASLLELHIGHAFRGEPLSGRPSSFRSLEARYADGQVNEVREAWSLGAAGIYAPSHGGNTGSDALFVYRSRTIPHLLPPEKFHAYLLEEGLELVLEERRRSGQQAATGRELYSRCARAFASPLHPTPALPPVAELDGGCRLEMRLRSGTAASGAVHQPEREVVVEMLFDGMPVQDLLLRHTTMSERGQQRTTTRRTDSRGQAVVPKTRGRHLLNAVHAMSSETPGFDWRTFWTSLSFCVADGAEGVQGGNRQEGREECHANPKQEVQSTG